MASLYERALQREAKETMTVLELKPGRFYATNTRGWTQYVAYALPIQSKKQGAGLLKTAAKRGYPKARIVTVPI
jgi:hypothetical protein